MPLQAMRVCSVGTVSALSKHALEDNLSSLTGFMTFKL